MKGTGGVYWEAIKGDMAGWSLMPGEPANRERSQTAVSAVIT